MDGRQADGAREPDDAQKADGRAADATQQADGAPVDAGALSGHAPLNLAQAPEGVRPCTLAAALELIGERWSLLALRELGYGVHRFSRIAAYTGAPRDILTDRLRKLETSGIVERRLYNEHPPRHEYHLTRAGHELFPAMISLLTWGERWAVDSPAVVFRHTCGQHVEIGLSCEHCGQPVTRASLTPVRAPSAPRA
jgi:DNA-binding HxlR family transcriptional regulator